MSQSDYYDHLGDMYMEIFPDKKETGKRDSYLKATDHSSLLSRMAAINTRKPLNILDPAVGTGKLLMDFHEKKPGYLLYGVDNDLRLLRIAMTNFSIHDISGHLLHANNLVHEIEIEKENGKYNWQFADKWHSHTDKLRPVSTKYYIPNS